MLLVYEYALTCGDEFRYIWRYEKNQIILGTSNCLVIRKTKFNGVLGAYLFSRYFALIVQRCEYKNTFPTFSGIQLTNFLDVKA